MKNKGFWITIVVVALFVGFIVWASILDVEKNEQETGIRMDSAERECYDFCDGKEYYFSYGHIEAAHTCECKYW